MGRKKFKDFISQSTQDNNPDFVAGVKTTAGITSTVKSVLSGTGGTAFFRGTAAGVDTYTSTITNIASYSANLNVRIAFTNANTGPATLNINGLGPIAIKKFENAALEAGDIKTGQILDLAYDGTNFQILSVTSNIVDAQ